MLFKKPEKIENIDASGITSGLYLKVGTDGTIIGATGGGGGVEILNADTYELMNSTYPPSSHTGEYCYVLNRSGWLNPFTTTRNAGLYYSNGTNWINDVLPEAVSVQDGSGNKYVGTFLNFTNGTVNGANGTVSIDVPTALSELSDDSTHRLVTDSEKSTWDNKQNALIEDLDYLTPDSNLGVHNLLYDTTKSTFISISQAGFTTVAGSTTKFPSFSQVSADSLSEFNTSTQRLMFKNPGWYFFNIIFQTYATGIVQLFIYKNGSLYSYSSGIQGTAMQYLVPVRVTSTSDYWEFYYLTSVSSSNCYGTFSVTPRYRI